MRGLGFELRGLGAVGFRGLVRVWVQVFRILGFRSQGVLGVRVLGFS